MVLSAAISSFVSFLIFMASSLSLLRKGLLMCLNLVDCIILSMSIPGLVIAIELVQDFMICQIRLQNLCYLMVIFINYLTMPLFINTFFVNIYFY